MDIRIPDIGDFADVPVIEVHVAPGDVVAAEDPLITLESDKATMDIPAPVAGTVAAIRVAVGDRVSAGHLIVNLRTGEVLEPEPAAPSAAADRRAPARALASCRTRDGAGRSSLRKCSSSAPDQAATRRPSGLRISARRS